MDRALLVEIGRVGRPWGNQGELTAQIDRVVPERLPSSGSLFVEIEGQCVPFHYDRIRSGGKTGTLIHFDELDELIGAELVIGRPLLMEAALAEDSIVLQLEKDKIIGLQVNDSKHGPLGSVIRMDGTDMNPVMVILMGTNEIMVPLADDYIDGFDEQHRILNISTPPGLIDFYL